MFIICLHGSKFVNQYFNTKAEASKWLASNDYKGIQGFNIVKVDHTIE
jgi:hypothetical protein